MFQQDLLKGKRILITGGGTGLGKAMAQRFMGLGANLYICGRRADVLSAAESELSRNTAGTIRALPCDVRKADAVDTMIDTIWKDGSLDGLVNNAAGNFLARTENLSVGAFEAVIAIVLMGTIHATLACGRRWLSSSLPATVLNISATYAPTGSAYVVPSATANAGGSLCGASVEWGKRYSHERHRARPDTHRGCILTSRPRPESKMSPEAIPANALERLMNTQISQRSCCRSFFLHHGEVIAWTRNYQGGEFTNWVGC
jgi:hypothetical protein